jgi:hypothetical protein
MNYLFLVLNVQKKYGRKEPMSIPSFFLTSKIKDNLPIAMINYYLCSFLCLSLCPVLKGAKKRTSSEAAKKRQPFTWSRDKTRD